MTWVETLKLEQRVGSRCLFRAYSFPCTCTSSYVNHTCTYILGALRSHSNAQLHWRSWHSPVMSNPKHNGREGPCTRVLDELQHLIEDLSQADAVMMLCIVYRRLVPSALLSCVICMQQLLWRTSYVFCWEIFGYCFKSQKITNFSQLVQDNIMEGTLNYSERYVKKSWNVRTRHRVVKSSWDVRNSHIKGTWKKPKGHIQNIWWRLRNLVSA